MVVFEACSRQGQMYNVQFQAGGSGKGCPGQTSGRRHVTLASEADLFRCLH